MTKTLISLPLSLVAATAFGQGWVNFDNTSTTLVSAGPIGQQVVISGQPNSYYFGLLIAPSGTADPSQFSFAAVYATNVGAAKPGRLMGSHPPVIVPGWVPGTIMSFLVAGWSSSLGHDWNQQWLSGNFGTAGYFGLSQIAIGQATGIDSPPDIPFDLFQPVGAFYGIQSGWNLAPITSVPEPSSIALAALGAAALILYTQRKKGIAILTAPPNKRPALDARTTLCLHIERHWPGASEGER
jgi:hypothetical protein